MIDQPVKVLRTFVYGGETWQRGEIRKLRGLHNDDALIRQSRWLVGVCASVTWCVCGLGFQTAAEHDLHLRIACRHPVVRRLLDSDRGEWENCAHCVNWAGFRDNCPECGGYGLVRVRRFYGGG